MINTLYNELHRPQFHFTAQKNWLNDPNGLVYYQGQYHLFFQHNPTSLKWGNMTWGHAVSPDLVHWEQLPHALEPDALGTMYSGSAVVDWSNTTGFQSGQENVLVAFYTAAGAHISPPQPYTQCLAYSNDRGKTWLKYDRNPVIGELKAGTRDPKVIWHEPSERWIMALYLDKNEFALFSSPDCKTWRHLHDLTMPGVIECPDFFELPLDGQPDQTQWVFWGANGTYFLGQFDGETFTPESDLLKAEYGANGFAAQTWSDIPEADGRRIQISWMSGGKYPAMPFNQQMSFPVELTLRSCPEGVRLCRQPVREIEGLYDDTVHVWAERTLNVGENLIPETKGELFDIRADVELVDAKAFGVFVRGHDLHYDIPAGRLIGLNQQADLAPVSSRIKLRLLVDRTSLEVFGNKGQMSMSSCFLPEAADDHLEFYTEDGQVKLINLTIHELRSAWQKSE